MVAVPDRSSDHRYPDYPFESRFFDVGGARMHYVDEGPRDAPPVVLVHGNPTWSFYFRHLITRLAGRYRVIAPDHVGMGLSDKPSASQYPYRLARRVSDLEALLEHLESARMTLCAGYDPASSVLHPIHSLGREVIGEREAAARNVPVYPYYRHQRKRRRRSA